MYCATCGTQRTPGLSYCKRCGAEQNAKGVRGNKLTEMPVESLVWAIVAMAVVGIGAPIGLMAVMKEVLHLESGVILGVAGLSFLPFLAADILFIWLMLRSTRANGEIGRAKGATTRELDHPEVRSLSATPPSIVEHTTHTLDAARSTSKSE